MNETEPTLDLSTEALTRIVDVFRAHHDSSSSWDVQILAYLDSHLVEQTYQESLFG